MQSDTGSSSGSVVLVLEQTVSKQMVSTQMVLTSVREALVAPPTILAPMYGKQPIEARRHDGSLSEVCVLTSSRDSQPHMTPVGNLDHQITSKLVIQGDNGPLQRSFL